MTPKSIWKEAQNKPTLVVRDLEHYVDSDTVYESLLRRGVFKWLSARRKIIKLKNALKGRIAWTHTACDGRQNAYYRQWLRGYRAGLEEARNEIRKICHGDRWEAPDFDKHAKAWLDSRTQNLQ